jgi:hypothetical protein
MTDVSDYRLTIELTPHFMSSAALRKKINKYRWQEIRRTLASERGLVCETCSDKFESREQLDAHEVFIYPSDGTVLLKKIQLLCKDCHAVKDFAHTERLISDGTRKRPNFREILVERFCRLNKCSVADFNKHYESASKTARELERRYGPDIDQGRINYGPYHSYYVKAQDPERFNTHTATSHAVGELIRNGILHEDYRETLLEIAKDDQQFAEKLLALVKAGDNKTTKAVLMEELEEYLSDDSAITDDEPPYWH